MGEKPVQKKQQKRTVSMMPDRKKVIKEFESFIKEFHPACTSEGVELDMFREVLALLKEQPEIVRCKDCKHGGLYCTGDVCGETLIECYRPDLADVIEINKWNWFCAGGKPKEGKKDG